MNLLTSQIFDTHNSCFHRIKVVNNGEFPRTMCKCLLGRNGKVDDYLYACWVGHRHLKVKAPNTWAPGWVEAASPLSCSFLPQALA